MLAIKTVIALLFLISLAFSATTITGNQSSYNPGDYVSVTVANNETCATWAHVSFNNSGTLNVKCGDVSYTSCPAPASAVVSCYMPADLINGSWFIYVRNDYDSMDVGYSNFTLNSTNANLSASSLTFLPGDTLTYYLITSYVNGDPFNINVSNFSLGGNGAVILNNCTNLTNSSVVRAYNKTCVLDKTAGPGSYQITAIYPNFDLRTNVSFNFTVNVFYRAPNVTLNVSSFRMERNTSYYVNISIWSSSNVNDTYYVNVTNCDGWNLSCSLNSSTNEMNISAFGYASMILNVTSWSWSNATNYSLGINVSNLSNIAYGNKTTLTAIVNPFHNFSLQTNASLIGYVPAGQTVTYMFRTNNSGESVTNYSLSCWPDNVNFTCALSQTVNNSINANPGDLLNFSLNVTASNSSTVNETCRVIVNVTDYYGLAKQIGPPYFTTNATESSGNISVVNTSQYAHYAGETYYFGIPINNTGNVNDELVYNITVVGQNLTGWTINVSNGSDFAIINDTSVTYNFTLNIPKLSAVNLSVIVNVPTAATYWNYTKLFILANSSTNSGRFSKNATVLIKIPYFNVTINMNYSKTYENLTFAISNITREDGFNLVSFSNLTYFITNGTGELKVNNTNATVGVLYNYSTNVNWSIGSYTLNITGNTTSNYTFSFKGVFYIAKWINFPMPTNLPSTASGQNFNVAIGSAFGNTSIATNASGSSQKPVIDSFNGGNCSQIPSLSGTTFTYTCTATATMNSTYAINASIRAASCSPDFTCAFIPSYYVVNSSTVVITYSGTSSGGQQGAPSGNVTNRTATTTTGLKITFPANVTLLNTSQTIYIPLNNTNTSRQNVSVNISEASDYIHFSLTYVAPKNISGNSTSTVNITLTPFKWAKPGTYTITVNINSVNSTFTVTVPQPNDTKKIHRYVEVSKNRATSMVTLGVKNRNGYSAFMNVTENISKQIAASAKNLTITSVINYTVIEQDPVVMWMMNMSQNQERSIIYLVAGDLGNSNLFKEPNVTEGRMSTGGGGTTTTTGGGDTTWLIIGIIVVVVIVAAVVVYLFFLKPRGIKLPIKYGAFVKKEKKGVGVLGALKGIPTKIMSIFKREKKEPIAGEKKGLLSRLSLKKKPAVKEEPKKEEKKIEPGKPKPTKEDLLKKLNEVYKK